MLEIRATIIITYEIAPHVGARHIPTHSNIRLEEGGNDGISTCHDPKRERMGSLTYSQTSIDVFFSTIDQIKYPFEL